MSLVMCVGTVFSGVALNNVKSANASSSNGEGYSSMLNATIKYSASLLSSPYVYGKFVGSNPYATSDYDGYHRELHLFIAVYCSKCRL